LNEQNKGEFKERKIYNDRQSENYNAFIGVMARLMQKYGNAVLDNIQKNKGGKNEQRG